MFFFTDSLGFIYAVKEYTAAHVLHSYWKWEIPDWPYTDSTINKYAPSIELYQDGEIVTLLVMMSYGDLYRLHIPAASIFEDEYTWEKISQTYNLP